MLLLVLHVSCESGCETVRLVACSCGSCNIVKIMGWGLDVGLQLWDVGPDISLLATVAGAETLYIYIN